MVADAPVEPVIHVRLVPLVTAALIPSFVMVVQEYRPAMAKTILMIRGVTQTVLPANQNGRAAVHLVLLTDPVVIRIQIVVVPVLLLPLVVTKHNVPVGEMAVAEQADALPTKGNKQDPVPAGQPVQPLNVLMTEAVEVVVAVQLT